MRSPPNEGWRLCAADARAASPMVSGRIDRRRRLSHRQKKSSARRKSPSLRPSPSVAPRSKSILFATIKHGTGKPPKPCITHGCSPLAKLSAVGAVGARKRPSRRHLSRPRLAPRPARARRRIVHDDHPVYLIVEYPSLSFILSMSAPRPTVRQSTAAASRVPRRRPPPRPPRSRTPPPRCTRSSARAPPRARARVRPARASASSSPPPSRRSRARRTLRCVVVVVALDADALCGRDGARSRIAAPSRARSIARRAATRCRDRPRRPSDARGSGDAARARTPLNPRGRS